MTSPAEREGLAQGPSFRAWAHFWAQQQVDWFRNAKRDLPDTAGMHTHFAFGYFCLPNGHIYT